MVLCVNKHLFTDAFTDKFTLTFTDKFDICFMNLKGDDMLVLCSQRVNI